MILVALCLWSCEHNGFTVKFSLPKDSEANYDISYYARAKEGGVTVQTVAPVMQGSFELKCISLHPTLLYISTRGMKLPVVVYAEPGQTIEINGETTEAYKWEISGNEINESMSGWCREYADTIVKGNQTLINEAVKNYIEENPDNPASALILLNYYSRFEDPEGFHQLWGTLRGEAQYNKWIELSSRSDLAGFGVTAPARLKSLVARSLSGYADTLRINKTGGNILFFWKTGFDDRKVFFDSIRALAKEFPDSSSRVIADFSFDLDSVAWKAPLKKDSLDNVARFWVPQGFADQTIMKLKVGHLPFFIVVSPEGKQIYRGEDTAKAFEAFRGLMPADSIDKKSAKK